jgi:hypothetical protein
VRREAAAILSVRRHRYDRACPTLFLRASTLVTVRGPVENSQTPPEDVGTSGDLERELPREEVLVRLYEIVHAYERRHGIRTRPCPYSAVRHAAGAGELHPFGFGCCRGLDVVDDAYAA